MKIPESRKRGRPKTYEREQALEIAMRLFWVQGYEGTSISDLTQAIGVTPPSLYASFGSKQQLFKEALDLYTSTYGWFAVRAMQEPTAKAAFTRLLDEAIELFCGIAGPRGCMLATLMTQCSGEHSAVADIVSARRKAVAPVLEARLAQGVQDGELSPNTAIAPLALFFCVVIQGLAVQARDGVGERELSAIAVTAMRAWPEP